MGKKKSKMWEWILSFKEKLLAIVVITACLSAILGAVATYLVYPMLDKKYATNEKLDKEIKNHKH